MTHWSDLNKPKSGEKFVGEGEFHDDFSNFTASTIVIAGSTYPTVEHFFQAMKTLDESYRDDIRRARTPGEAKVRGRAAPLRDDWNEIRYDVMLIALRAKFRLKRFRSTLLNFEGNIVEWNTWHDQIWGVCICTECDRVGLNLLGNALEQIRDELQFEERILGG